MKAIVLSDVHLRDAESVKTRLVIRFLQEKASQFERVFILGDLFDAWTGTNAFLVRKFKPVIQVLKHLVDEGHDVHYVEGNHDFHLGEYFSESLGIKVHPDNFIDTWEGKRVFMAHGDLGNPKEFGYRALRKILRHDITKAALRALPSDFVFNLGAKGSKLSRQYQKHSPEKESEIRQTYRNTAERIFREGYDVVIMGHTHLPDDVTTLIGNRQCRYINTGDFVSHFTYLEFDGSQFYTRTHPVKDL